MSGETTQQTGKCVSNIIVSIPDLLPDVFKY